ncbi:sulfotransferase family 2 domain-containing protein [Winogradskyella poriferorum]|uniref:sulfotransferase family 2 domain-containing protein n=1 Tax=Winogradskyella poriferorum TaxID=307627 RepID=UPI003D6623F5
MISHKYKCIFIHIPKCAGSSIQKYFHPYVGLNWKEPNYDILYGWCPKRKIHLQHATSKILLETELISEENWKNYFKFTIVRNPWDRAYSDYFWIQKERNINGSFSDYIQGQGPFYDIFNLIDVKEYRGDHLNLQTDFFDFEGLYKLDAILKFESLNSDMSKLVDKLNFDKKFRIHENKSPLKKKLHYSKFYTDDYRSMVEHKYMRDIKQLGYVYENRISLKSRISDFFSGLISTTA